MNLDVDICARYESSYDAQTQKETLTCVGCAAHYYLNTENDSSLVCLAVQTTISECARYDSNQKCTECDAGHLLINDQSGGQRCMPHCAAATGDLCTTCATNFYLTSEGKCAEVYRVIDHCRAYANEDSCRECEEEFELADDNTRCVSISNIPYCEEEYPVQCLVCGDGHRLSDDNKCIKLENFNKIDFCEIQNHPSTCQKC